MPPPDQKAEATVEAENIQPQPPGYVETEFEVSHSHVTTKFLNLNTR